MTLEDLISEAKALAKPCIFLVDDDETLPVAAVWRGDGIVNPYANFEHWITADCRFFPNALALQGCVSIYTHENEGGSVQIARNMPLPVSASGTKLFAKEALSYPPIDAIFRFGTLNVASWLEANKWQRGWEYNDNFPDPVAEEYEKFYQSKTPIYFQGPFAQLGGWHMPWPDGDWEQLLSSNFVLWTFRDSEPWLEVWESGGNYTVIQRIT